MIQQWRLMLARFPYGGTERTELIDWCAACSVWAKRQENIESFVMWNVNDTPITMCRNLAVLSAIAQKIDFLCMVDSDMAPDIDRTHPFLPSALEFAIRRYATAPTIIAAPYLTAAPAYMPTMGRWRSFNQGSEIHTDLYTREEAAQMTGIQPCSLMGTGLMLLDMRIFTGFRVGEQELKLRPPWFYYEFSDEYHVQKASTEDMVFTRNASLLFAQHGLEIGFVDWDAWATHVKTQFVGKPYDLSLLDVVGAGQPQGD